MKFKSKPIQIEVAGHTVTIDAKDRERVEARLYKPYRERPFSTEQPGFAALAETDKPSALLGSIILDTPAFVELVNPSDHLNYTRANMREYVNRGAKQR